MKREDIDKKIGLPDVDAEWAKFEREVVNQKTASRKSLYWGIGIAASIALLAGIFLFGHGAEEPQKLLAEQTLQTPPLTPPLEGRGVAAPSVVPPASQNNIMRGTSDLQGRIAGLNEIDIPDSVRQARKDSVERERDLRRDSMLIVVNGSPIFGGWHTLAQQSGLSLYLYKQHQLLSDSDLNAEEKIGRAIYQPYGSNEEERKRRCFERYGERAKYGVVEVTTVPDMYCDDYISKHPNLKEERHHIEGYVYDENNKPLADTWVHIRDKGIGAATDSIGYFSIWLPQTDVELKASHIGYVPYVVKTIKPMLTIQLRSATTLREVKVTPKQL